MSEKLPNMLEATIQKIREMVDVNSVIGEPINTPDGVTIIRRSLPFSFPAMTLTATDGR